MKFEIKYLDPNLESRKCPTCCSTVKTHLCTDRRIQSKTTSVSNQNYDVFSRASYKESINGGISRLCHQRSCRHEVSDKYWRKQFIWTMRSACELILWVVVNQFFFFDWSHENAITRASKALTPNKIQLCCAYLEYLWISLNIFEYLWISLNIFEYLWISLNTWSRKIIQFLAEFSYTGER